VDWRALADIRGRLSDFAVAIESFDVPDLETTLEQARFSIEILNATLIEVDQFSTCLPFMASIYLLSRTIQRSPLPM